MIATIAAIAIANGPASAPIPTPSRFARFITELIANDSFPSTISTGAIAATTPATTPIIVSTVGDSWDNHCASFPTHSTIFCIAGTRNSARDEPICASATDPISFIVSSWSLN